MINRNGKSQMKEKRTLCVQFEDPLSTKPLDDAASIKQNLLCINFFSSPAIRTSIPFQNEEKS